MGTGQCVSYDEPSPFLIYTRNQSICFNADTGKFILTSVSDEFEFELFPNDICLQ